jgi:hypothetical protein
MVEWNEQMSGTDKEGNSGRKNGRPKKGDIPRVPYDELERILVFGEVVTCEDGVSTTVHYPSYRDLARRYNVSNSLIAKFAKAHNCLRRRRDAQTRIAAKADQKLVEIRSTALALSKEDELRIIDSYLVGFEKALTEERVRFDNPSDFNTMVRLKEFVQGGADSRQEIHAALSLEDIQTRHKRMMKDVEATSAKERGDVEYLPPAALPQPERLDNPNAPASPFDPASEKVSGHLSDHYSDQGLENSPDNPASPQFERNAEDGGMTTVPGSSAKHGPTVAHQSEPCLPSKRTGGHFEEKLTAYTSSGDQLSGDDEEDVP